MYSAPDALRGADTSYQVLGVSIGKSPQAALAVITAAQQVRQDTPHAAHTHELAYTTRSSTLVARNARAQKRSWPAETGPSSALVKSAPCIPARAGHLTRDGCSGWIYRGSRIRERVRPLDALLYDAAALEPSVQHHKHGMAFQARQVHASAEHLPTALNLRAGSPSQHASTANASTSSFSPLPFQHQLEDEPTNRVLRRCGSGGPDCVHLHPALRNALRVCTLLVHRLGWLPTGWCRNTLPQLCQLCSSHHPLAVIIATQSSWPS